LAPGSELRLIKTDRGVLIELAELRYKLADLVKRMTPENTPGEIEWGAALP
jgi:antitoxin component of MazEF toxin-antitoxin module